MLSFKRPCRPVDDPTQNKLPMALEGLADYGVYLRRSELTMFAGIPGAGKSSVALDIAIRTAVPTLYIAADTAEMTMRIRTLASITGLPQAECEAALEAGTGDDTWFDKAEHIAWCFDASPTIDSIYLEVDAFEEVHGQPPALIVVDNLSDVADSDGDEWQVLRAMMKLLKILARDTQAAVLVLHHISEGADNFKGSNAPPRRAIQGKVSQLPALVVTLEFLEEASTMYFGIVKHRYGKFNKNGSYGPAMHFDPVRMRFTPIQQRRF